LFGRRGRTLPHKISADVVEEDEQANHVACREATSILELEGAATSTTPSTTGNTPLSPADTVF